MSTPQLCGCGVRKNRNEQLGYAASRSASSSPSEPKW
ncbi:hypothetical protein QO010_004043 [Caulobacter ginsengisoli]|uniref:Uncharacterized protein n=1 Tax=Caulobacter ginsengisoli TaxID=400775 RepID=A0ABU0IW68_9CAUL|nr:hypothetical protein [Caulobacter ginsengisoli]